MYALGGGEGDGGGAGDEGATREVVEPDVIRRHDNLLYVLNQFRGLSLVDLETETVLAQVPTTGYPRDLYVVGDRAYVLVGYAADYTVDGLTVGFDVRARLYVVDVSDPANASIIAAHDLQGDLVDSRLVGNVLYAICAEFGWFWGGGIPVKAQTSSSWVTSVHVGDPANIHPVDEVSFAGLGDVVQATSDAIFVAASDWSTDSTAITYVDISDPGGLTDIRGSVTVPGDVADRFKMDAYNGVLRIVSGSWRNERRVHLTTVDLADPDVLEVIASNEFLRARGERLFATRFDGDRAYIVTFFVVDPLFVVDLSDPANPQVTGELETPGWSTHIEPRGDTLVALGVDNTKGSQVTVSLFDVTDPTDPSLADRVWFGDDWSWSNAYADVKAFSVFDDMILVPFSGWGGGFGGYDRLQFVSYAPGDLETRGYVDLDGAAIRSFEYADAYYAVTAEYVSTIDASDLDNPDVTGRATLAENMADFLELSPTVAAEIVSELDTGMTRVRTVGLATKAIGEATVKIGQLVDAHVYGQSVVLVGTVWNNLPEYRVAIVDCSDPAAPDVLDTLQIPVEPFHGGWWPMMMDSPGKMSIAFMPPMPYAAQNTTFVVGNALALRCFAPEYDQRVGNGHVGQGLALVDLDARAWTSMLGLGFDSIDRIGQAGDKLYISSRRPTVSKSLFGNPMCAHFLTELDLAGPVAGPTVNTPGTFVHYNPATDVLTLRDEQWLPNFEHRTDLRTVSWDGGETVAPIAEMPLPQGVGLVMGRDGRVYFERYHNGVHLHSATVGADGALTPGPDVLVTQQWASLIDARGSSAYVSVGPGAIARYDFDNAPSLGLLVEAMGTPRRIRFGTDAAYAPLGYFGVVPLPYN